MRCRWIVQVDCSIHRVDGCIGAQGLERRHHRRAFEIHCSIYLLVPNNLRVHRIARPSLRNCSPSGLGLVSQHTRAPFFSLRHQKACFSSPGWPMPFWGVAPTATTAPGRRQLPRGSMADVGFFFSPRSRSRDRMMGVRRRPPARPLLSCWSADLPPSAWPFQFRTASCVNDSQRPHTHHSRHIGQRGPELRRSRGSSGGVVAPTTWRAGPCCGQEHSSQGAVWGFGAAAGAAAGRAGQQGQGKQRDVGIVPLPGWLRRLGRRVVVGLDSMMCRNPSDRLDGIYWIGPGLTMTRTTTAAHNWDPDLSVASEHRGTPAAAAAGSSRTAAGRSSTTLAEALISSPLITHSSIHSPTTTAQDREPPVLPFFQTFLRPSSNHGLRGDRAALRVRCVPL